MINVYNIMPNCIQVCIAKLSIFFSFKIPVAYRSDGNKTIFVCDNLWGKTTQKHIDTFTIGHPYTMIPQVSFKTQLKAAYSKSIIQEAERIRLDLLNINPQEDSHDTFQKRPARPALDLADGVVE